MKNKCKYKLTDLKISLVKENNHNFALPVRHWEVRVIKDGNTKEKIIVNGGSLSDLMAWLESEINEK